MLRSMLTGFIVLTISYGACFLTYASESVALNKTDTLVGKADPKFKCVEVCTLPIDVCIGVGCEGKSVDDHCGHFATEKFSLKKCEEDSAGGLSSCTDDISDGVCYKVKPCKCVIAVELPGLTILACNKVTAGKAQDSPNTVSHSSDCADD